jgi:[acyl-carrier-protein] S-malonyltransferase
MTVIFMFPGQSSRYPEMLDRLIDAWPDARSVVQEAEAVLGRELLARYRAGAGAFESNRDIQVGVFLCSYLHARALAAQGVVPDASLGLSLGEYNHLVQIGALDFADALRLVDARGAVYDAGPAGSMACIQPAGEEDLAPLLERFGGQVAIANFNSPTQQVIAGAPEAMEEALALCEDELFVQPIVIEKKIPMHTEVFRPASEALRPHLEAAAWRRPTAPYLPNVAGRPVEAPSPAEFVSSLTEHVYRPVLWRQSIDWLTEAYPGAAFVEVGPRGVLYNLLQKRWHDVVKFKSDTPDDLSAHLASLPAELAALTTAA